MEERKRDKGEEMMMLMSWLQDGFNQAEMGRKCLAWLSLAGPF